MDERDAAPRGDAPDSRLRRRASARRPKGLVREAVETLGLALLIFLSVRSVGSAYEVEGRSMTPSLHNEQRLFVARAAYAHLDLRGLLNLLPGEDRAGEYLWYPFDPPGRGDIVVFESPEGGDDPLIKRVIALPGERVAVADGAVFVNGRPLAEPYLRPNAETACDEREVCDLVVPPGHVFVLGDNRSGSNDSRAFGPVAVDRIVGKAVVSFWPPDDAGRVPEPDYADLPDGGP
jgi:signal peptidase I